MQKRLFDIRWSDESECQACQKRGRHRKVQALPQHRIKRHQTGETRGFQNMGAEYGSKKREPQLGSESGKEVLVRILLSESQWNWGHVIVKKWESEKHKSWSMPAEGFKGHAATNGSRLVSLENGEHVVGQWCSWIMKRRWSGCMYGSVEAEFEVQRCWMEDSWRRQEQKKKRSNKKEKNSMPPAFTVWWNNGKIAKNFSRNQKKYEFSRISKRRKRSIERSGVLMPTSIDV